MDDPHLSYTKDQIAKNLIALEDHFKNYPCPVCINKHLLSLEEYTDEGQPMSDELRPLFKEVGEWSRDLRFADHWDMAAMIKQARSYRERFQSVSHERFHAEPVCRGPECLAQVHQHG